MKKLLYSIMALSLLYSCQDADVVYKENLSGDRTLTSSSRSMEEAIEIAVNAARMLDKPQSRSVGRSASAKGVKIIRDAESRSDVADSLIYVVNFDDEQGFALVPVPRIETDVLAVVDDGAYDPAAGTDNPGFNLYLEAANAYVKRQAANGGISTQAVISPALIYKTVIDTIAEYQCPPRLRPLAWGQYTPYNKYTPNGIAGSAPVAMAMIISDMYPKRTKLDYTFPERDQQFEDVVWRDLLTHKKNSAGSLEIGHVCSATNPAGLHNTIGRVIRQIGAESNTVYNPNYTRTDPANFEYTLKLYLPDRTITPFRTFKTNSSPEMDALNWGYLLMHARYSGGNHTWVAEGYHFLKTHKTVYEYDHDTKTWNPFTSETIVRHKFYFNWGWNGQYNGYYEKEVFTPYEGLTLQAAQYMGVYFTH